MMQRVYVSSLAFKNMSICRIGELAKQYNFSIEFTSNIPYDTHLLRDYLDVRARKMVHNYFPTPSIPFVLNLASSDENVLRRSIEHCIQGLKLCKESEASFFAAHAGFCLDPTPSELGGKFAVDTHFNRDLHLEIFLKSLKKIVGIAEKLNIPFLFENNVLIASNIAMGQQNPLLCCDSEEICMVLKEMSSEYLGFLLDTAHLKVTCNTLQLNLSVEVNKLRHVIDAIHHSDNDGFVDNNQPLTDGYWFFEFLREFEDKVHVIEVYDLSIAAIQEQLLLLNKHGNKGSGCSAE